jgi:cyanate permease
MAALNSPDYIWLWTLLLAAALFYPVRQLIWVIQVRRAERDGNQDETRRAVLRMRATVTSILLCGVFSLLYTAHLFSNRP